jgi:hypothetical protein
MEDEFLKISKKDVIDVRVVRFYILIKAIECCLSSFLEREVALHSQLLQQE